MFYYFVRFIFYFENKNESISKETYFVYFKLLEINIFMVLDFIAKKSYPDVISLAFRISEGIYNVMIDI